MGIYSNSNIHEEYAELVNRVQSGDENAFAEIYQKSERLVYTTCYEVLHSKEDAEDAMQDTYAALFENIANIKEGKALVDWIKTTAYYKAVHIRDKNKPDVAYEDALANEEISEVDDNIDILPESYVTDKANRAIIRDILRQKLSDDQYDAILLYYYSEMPVSQIAEVMHCPEGTVKTRLSEGRKKIKKGIESYEKLHGDRLAGAAGVPFLTRFFIESAKELTLPVINPFPVNIPATPSAVGELTETGAKAGKLAQATSTAGELSETGEPMGELAKDASKAGSFAKNAGTAGSGAKAGVLASPLAKIGIAVLAVAAVAVPTVIAVKNIKKTADEMRDEKISEIEEETEETESNVDPVVTSETDEPSLDDKVKSSYLQVVTEHESGIRTHEQYSQQGLELVPPVESINFLDINGDGINEMIFMECDSSEECTLSIYTYNIETESAELMVNSLMSEPSMWSWREILMLDNGNLLVITYDSYRGNYREGMVEYQIDNTELVAVNEWIAYGCRMWYGETDLHPFSNVYLNEQLSSESEYLAAVQEYADHVISPVYPIACRFENDGFICDHDVLCTDTFDFYGSTFKKGNYYLYDDFVAMLKGEIPDSSTPSVTATPTNNVTVPNSEVVEVYIADSLEVETNFYGPMTVTYNIPGIRINGVEDKVVNDFMNEDIHKYISKDWYLGSKFNYYVTEDYVSILVFIYGEYDQHKMTAYNISLATGELMTDDEFLEANGITKDEFYALVKSTMELAMSDNESLFTGNPFADYYSNNLSDERIRSARPYTSGNGNLCYISDVEMNGGAEMYTACFDTKTHEHMSGAFGQWSTFNSLENTTEPIAISMT